MFLILHRLCLILLYGALVAVGVYVFQQREWFVPVIDHLEVWRNHSADQKKVIQEATGEVSKVIDGNTVQIKGVPGLVYVRLAGIDAPNLRHLNHGREFALGGESRTNLSELVLSNEVHLKILQTNQFGYASAIIFRDGTNINARVVELGMARVNSKLLAGLPTRERKSVQRAEENARQQRAGMWRTPATTNEAGDFK